MNPIKTDILISGGGISGLIMAKSILSLNLGLDVICIEKNPIRKSGRKDFDLRTTALLHPAIEFFKEIGIWEKYRSNAQALNSLVICNLNKNTERIDSKCEFFAKDLNLSTLGYNLSNHTILEKLQELLRSEKNFRYFSEDCIENITPRSFDIVARTKKKDKIISKFILATDGKNSRIREISKISSFKYDYNQYALVFTIKHEYNHESKSYEIYESEGPCTLVPIKTKKFNGHYSSVVLMQKNFGPNQRIDENDYMLSDFITKRTGNILGECKVETPAMKFPIISQVSKSLTADRVILLAESAHVLPPIGAQGLNTSIHDIINLTALIKKKINKDKQIGNIDFLKDYENSRKIQVASRMLSVHFLNKLSISNNDITSNIRRVGLTILEKNKSYKKFAMKFGMFQ